MGMQVGNVLFIILIAIALFAALTYSVAGSSRTSSNAIGREKAEVVVSELLSYGASLRSAVARVRMECKPEQISFQHDIFPTQTVNPNAPTSEKCHIFSPSGGNMYQKETPTSLERLSQPYYGSILYQSARIPNIGTEKNEVVLALSFYGPREVCLAFNKLTKNEEYTNDLPEVDSRYGLSHRAFGGVIYSGSNGTITLSDFAGRDAGCLFNTNDYNGIYPRYVIFMTLLEL